ncbi:hypothetical protein ON010_g7437 [Phytophthora cinnamomi]|nr:hypothetical protein ON010_g7437 [Phytophthora cinnamomi]
MPSLATGHAAALRLPLPCAPESESPAARHRVRPWLQRRDRNAANLLSAIRSDEKTVPTVFFNDVMAPFEILYHPFARVGFRHVHA